MNIEEISRNLTALKEKYTFDRDKRKVEVWEGEVKKKLIRKELANADGIKELISELAKKINDFTYWLAWDKTLTEQERNNLYIERDCYWWLLSFFTDPAKSLNNLQNKVEKELKNLEE